MSDEFEECPICGLSNQEVLRQWDYGDKVRFDCERCGQFEISRTAESIAKNNQKDKAISAWLRERNLLGVEIPLLTTNFISEIFKNIPKFTPLEKQEKLLKAISILSDYPGKPISLSPVSDASLAWAKNQTEFKYYLDSLIERGLLKNARETYDDPDIFVIITGMGWEFLESNENKHEDKLQCFVAMSFDQELKSIFDQGISPAIRECGYRPYRVDSEPHLERIDAKIISEILESRFLVADVTGQKAGVYYEAGFAHGLGIPVIWSVRKDELDKVHFDTRQYNHIVWEDENNLKEQLVRFVLATIGRR
jgi:nucleoside 2-deoxyribosyltransferase